MIREQPHSSSDFWKIIKNSLQIEHQHNELPLIHNGTIYASPLDKANILNSFFQSQSNLTIPNTHTHIPNIQNPDCPVLENFIISRQDVIDSIKAMKTGKASGSDQLNSIVLKEVAVGIAGPLQNIFNFSIKTGRVSRT